MKVCSKCGEERDDALFRNRRCQPCRTATHRQWVAANPARAKAIIDRQKSDPAFKQKDAEAHRRRYAVVRQDAEWKARNAEWAKQSRARETQEQKEHNEAQRARSAAILRGAAKAELVFRKAIIERDHSTCYLWCKARLQEDEVELDHVIPLARGGEHTANNLRVACRSCNRRKGDRLLSEIKLEIAHPDWYHCSRCHAFKHSIDFWWSKKGHSMLRQKHCKECQKLARAERRSRHISGL